MNTAGLCTELKVHRNAELDTVLTATDPGYHNPVPEADTTEFLTESATTGQQTVNSNPAGFTAAALGNAVLSDFQRAHLLSRESRIRRFTRINRTRKQEAMESGNMDTRLGAVELKLDEDFVLDIMGVQA